MSEKIVAVTHSKHRNAFGLVGIEVDTEKLLVNVRLSKQWRRDQINQISKDIADAYSQIKWDGMFIDQMVGEHFIKDIKREGLSLHVITTKNKVIDPADIDRIMVMDQIEMTQLMLALKLDHRIQFPPSSGESMKQLIKQVELFTENKTEAGGISYYSPGDELDNLTKSLMICCFAVRNILAGDDGTIVCGPVMKKSPRSIADYKLTLNKHGLSPDDYR